LSQLETFNFIHSKKYLLVIAPKITKLKFKRELLTFFLIKKNKIGYSNLNNTTKKGQKIITIEKITTPYIIPYVVSGLGFLKRRFFVILKLNKK
jgi:hypothetical protein